MSILEDIHGQADLMRLNPEQRERLCEEIRQFLISHIAKTGGHLASNLGIVELSVALETVFDTSVDRLVFDVGHQSYVHKLLTGRQADFARLRQFGGIAGFPKPSESNTDAFVAGHASSSVSVALGMARARTLCGENYNVIALLGDGAATGGMVYEGINDAAVSNEPMIVILNDNEMSIDRNVGGMASHLSALRSKKGYLGIKKKYRSVLKKTKMGRALYRITHKLKNWIRRSLIPTTIFENMGMTYLGPVDGHDVNKLTQLLQTARDLECPVLVHVMTQKGRGYTFAENEPSKFHGISPFDPLTGSKLSKPGKTFSAAFGETMCTLAEKNPKVCAITAAMPGGTGLLKFAEQYPERLFDVGIAEEHAVSMAGGLAKQGMTPVVALYSTFLQRSFDQILQDVAMLNLHVVFAIDRAGLVGEDGETHHGVFDLGFLRQVPGMTVLCPANCLELQQMLTWAVEEGSGPIAIRYPRGSDGALTDSFFGKNAVCHRTGMDAVIVTYSTMAQNAMSAAELLSQQGVEVTVLRLLQVNPLPIDEILTYIPEKCPVFLAEDAGNGSGIREALAWELGQKRPGCLVDCINLGGSFATHGKMADLYRHYGLDAEGIAHRVLKVIHNEG